MTDTAQCAKCAFKIDLPHSDMLEIFYKDHNCELTALQEAIQRVRELHYKDEYGFCSECYWQSDCLIEEYPCRTLKALEGEQ